MGLFGKKDDCPVCGNEVKGLFLKKIGGKKTLCKECSKAISMDDDILKNADADYVAKHIERRRANAAIYASTEWERKYSAFGLRIGVNRDQQLVYINYDKMDNEDNPTIFSFDSITGYEFYRNKKLLENDQEAGDTPLNTGLGAAASVINMLNDKDNNYEAFHIKLKTTNEYWPELDLKMPFTDSQLFGIGGKCDEVQAICQVFKRIVRKEEVRLPEYL